MRNSDRLSVLVCERKKESVCILDDGAKAI